jgi:hypothetical protein
MTKSCLCMLVPCLCWWMPSLTARAETRYVVPNNPAAASPFTNWYTAATNIQHAVDVAADGDTVLLTNGIFFLTNEVLVKSRITIQSVNGPIATVVDARGSNRVFHLNYPNAGVEGLTIKNGYAPSKDGGGVYGTSNNFIRNCLVVSNRAGWDGGGAYLTRGGLVEDSTIFANSANFSSSGNGGGGLCLRYTGTVRRTLIWSNYCSANAGGLFVYEGRVENCTIVSNKAAWSGGGIWIERNSVLRESVIEFNTANLGGGGLFLQQRRQRVQLPRGREPLRQRLWRRHLFV